MSSTYTEDNNPIYISTIESVNWIAGSPLTLIQYKGTPGVVESIQFAENGRNFNAVLNIVVDGYITQCSEPAFFGFSLDPQSSKVTGPVQSVTTQYSQNDKIFAGINNKNYIGQCSYSWGCTKRVFIPFQDNISIAVAGNDRAATVNSQVIYRKWPSAFPLYYSVGTRRKYWRLIQDGTWGSPISLSAYQSHTTTSIQGTGQIEFITHVLWGVSKAVSGDSSCNPMSCLEGACSMKIDGVDVDYATTDNFYGGNYYWNDGITLANNSDWGLFTYQGQAWQGDFNMHAYRFGYDKPIFFNTSFTMTWNYGDSTKSQFGQGVTNCSSIFLISYWLESTS